jgi:hypothetical protein
MFDVDGIRIVRDHWLLACADAFVVGRGQHSDAGISEISSHTIR